MKSSFSIYGSNQPGDTLLNQAGFLTSALSLDNYVLLKLVHLWCFLVRHLIFCQCQSSGINFFSFALVNFNMFVNVFGYC